MSKNGVREGGILMAGCCASAGVAAGMVVCSSDGMMAGCWVSAGVGAGMVVCSCDGAEVMAGCFVLMVGWEGGSSWERGAGGGASNS